MLFRCQNLEDDRKCLFDNLLYSMPPAMQEQYMGADNNNKVAMLLSGFNSNYIPEWNQIFANIVVTITELYNIREQKLIAYDLTQHVL